MINFLNEQRRAIRKNIQVPLKLQMFTDHHSPSQDLLAYSKDMSQSGLSVILPADFSMDQYREIKVYLDSYGSGHSYSVPVKVAWHSKECTGFQFLQKAQWIQNLVEQESLFTEIDAPAKYLREFHLYVNGKDVETGNYDFYPYTHKLITDPHTVLQYKARLKQGESLRDAAEYFYACYSVGNSQLNHEAVLSAHKAFQTYRLFSLERRRKILDDIRKNLIAQKENLIRLMIIEGHPRKVAEWEYSGMLTGLLTESLNHYQSELFKRVAQIDGELLIEMRRPDGVICVVPPKNASCSNSLTASLALFAGNTLVVKPPRNNPISAFFLWKDIVIKALEENQAPPGTVNIILGNAEQFLKEWIASPYVKGILFFNDSVKGLEIGKEIYAHGKKPILELSGNDFLCVWKDAPIEEAADSLLDCFMGSTQICMVPKKALIHEDIYPDFMKVFLKKVRNLKIGLPSDPETMLSPVLKIEEFFTCLQDALDKGAKLLTGGMRVDHLGQPCKNGVYLTPTVIEVPSEQALLFRCVQEENFFPLLPVIKVKGQGSDERSKDRSIFETMMRLLDANQYGLRISVWVRNQYYTRRFMEEVHSSGLLRINTRHIGFSPCLATHGGVGKSGGPFGEMNFVWQKSSHLQGITLKTLPETP